MTKVPLPRRVKIPTEDRQRGSALLADLRRVMVVFGMEEALGGVPLQGNSSMHQARRGNPARLKPGYGFVPIGGAWANRVRVWLPQITGSFSVDEIVILSQF
jgi:hypothetical protein